STLNADAVGNLAHSERRVQTAVALGDADAFEGLQTLAVAFLDLDLNDHGVTGAELGQILLHLFSVKLRNNLVGAHGALLSFTVPSFTASKLSQIPLLAIQRQQLLFLGRQRPALQQIRAPLQRATQCLLQAPATDLLVIATEQYIRHCPAPVLL